MNNWLNSPPTRKDILLLLVSIYLLLVTPRGNLPSLVLILVAIYAILWLAEKALDYRDRRREDRLVADLEARKAALMRADPTLWTAGGPRPDPSRRRRRA